MVEKAWPTRHPPERESFRNGVFSHTSLAPCKLCGALVLPEQMDEHLLGDEVMLRIIRHNNPGWSPKDCLEYYVRTYRPGTYGTSALGENHHDDEEDSRRRGR